MANPLMPAILKNTLNRMGKGKAENRVESSIVVQTANLSSEQESLLKNSVLRSAASKAEYKPESYTRNDNQKMVTLEGLRKTKADSVSSPAGEKSRETVGKNMVSLASIGKVYKK